MELEVKAKAAPRTPRYVIYHSDEEKDEETTENILELEPAEGEGENNSLDGTYQISDNEEERNSFSSDDQGQKTKDTYESDDEEDKGSENSEDSEDERNEDVENGNDRRSSRSDRTHHSDSDANTADGRTPPRSVHSSRRSSRNNGMNYKERKFSSDSNGSIQDEVESTKKETLTARPRQNSIGEDEEVADKTEETAAPQTRRRSESSNADGVHDSEDQRANTSRKSLGSTSGRKTRIARRPSSSSVASLVAESQAGDNTANENKGLRKNLASSRKSSLAGSVQSGSRRSSLANEREFSTSGRGSNEGTYYRKGSVSNHAGGGRRNSSASREDSVNSDEQVNVDNSRQNSGDSNGKDGSNRRGSVSSEKSKGEDER